MILPRLAYNFLSAVGATIALIDAITIFVLLVVSMMAETTNPYLGVLLYMVLPVVLVFGLVLIPIGMYRQAQPHVHITEIRELRAISP